MRTLRLALFAPLALLGCTPAAPPQGAATAAPAATPAPTNLLAGGYLAREALPDSLALLPPAPAAGSPTQARDAATSAATLPLRGSARWDQATSDADLMTPAAMRNAMSCAAGVTLSAEATPATYALLRRAAADLALATYAAKNHYRRPRPFMVNGQPTCTPDWEARLRQDGSYPSGHAALGYGWGLILAELIPARATQLVARGHAFADSRVVCNVHWQSDVEGGRSVAAAVVARQHADPAFQRDLATARAELADPALPSAPACSAAALAPLP
jgi:acid phosphatase (class A)